MFVMVIDRIFHKTYKIKNPKLTKTFPFSRVQINTEGSSIDIQIEV